MFFLPDNSSKKTKLNDNQGLLIGYLTVLFNLIYKYKILKVYMDQKR